jgi:predicted transcriptional regulator
MQNVKQALEKDLVLLKIISILKNEDLSIAELQRKINMKRSTLAYYLNLLEKDSLISRERIKEKKIGRPTIIKFNKVEYEKKRIALNQKLAEERNFLFSQISSNPLTKKILNIIKNNEGIDFTKLLNDEEIRNYPKKFPLINWLHQNEYIIEAFYLTDKGKDFLNKV